MKLRILILSALLGFTALIQAQAPPADIRGKLRELSVNEKLKLLEYMRQMGSDLDKEVQHTYEQLNDEKRRRAMEFIEMKKSGAPMAVTGSTTVRFSKDTVIFGNIEEGVIIIDTFQFQNTGNAPYIIKEVKTSCDCTVLKKPEFPVMPGETSTLRVEFDSNGKAGASTPGIILYDNSVPNGRNILYLKGSVSPRKKAKPEGSN
jgi:hypothetical protein